MNKNLPKVYVSPINKELRNNKDIFYSALNMKKENNVNVLQKINEIFANPHHVYKSKVNIITDKGNFEVILVGQNRNELLTLDGSRINIRDIVDIERI